MESNAIDDDDRKCSMGWLERYATGYHEWKRAQHEDVAIFYRPLGIVELAFDSDGIFHEGRSDINMAISFEVKTNLSKEALRRHILLAWTNLRLRHTLLGAASSSIRDYMEDESAAQRSNRFHVVRRPRNSEDAIRSAGDAVDFLGDYYSTVEANELYYHAQNVARVLDPEKNLARLLVLPLEKSTATVSTYKLRFLFLIAHQISDGLANSAWTVDFMRLLNKKAQRLHGSIEPLILKFHERLPLPQEDLYPPISGSRARQRWFWALTLVLRHVQKPLAAAFQNPLRFPKPVKPTVPDENLFDRVLDYSKAPELGGRTIRIHLGRESTRRLHRLCRQAGCSLGSGMFVLVGIVMMEMYEERSPDVPADQRRPFVGSFPIDPRPFFNHKAVPDSMMLAFSDGVVLPFLSSDLDLDGRIRLLVRSAQRQLSRYQKRPRRDTNMLQYMGPRGAGRVIAMNYLDVQERANRELPEHLLKKFHYQKHLAIQENPTMATCGVSSVGRYSPYLTPGQYDLERPLPEGEEALVADIRDVNMNVRPRDGEFLVGIWGTDDWIAASVAYDACTIDAAWAERWKDRMESFLEEGADARL